MGGLANQSGDGVEVWRAKGGAELELHIMGPRAMSVGLGGRD